MSKRGAIATMGILTAAFAREVNDATLRLYVENLQDLPDDALRSVATDIVRTSRWLPSIAEIRERTIKTKWPELLPPAPDEAWSEIEARLHDERRRTEPWSHPSVSDALEAVGGFYAVRMTTNLDALRRRFYGAYSAPRERTVLNLLRSSAYATLGNREAQPTPAIGSTQTHEADQQSFGEA